MEFSIQGGNHGNHFFHFNGPYQTCIRSYQTFTTSNQQKHHFWEVSIASPDKMPPQMSPSAFEIANKNHHFWEVSKANK